MNIALIAFSEKGLALAQQLRAKLSVQGHLVKAQRCEPNGLLSWTAEHFVRDDALVFIGSCGIAVRAIAPHVSAKTTDPAVVVVDETGCFSISLLSGHLGGANKLASQIAGLLGAVPVITTATDRNHLFALDSWARDQNLRIANPERIKHVSARLLAGESQALSSCFPIKGKVPQGITLSDEGGEIILSFKQQPGSENALHLVPPALTLGLGCKRGTKAETLESAFLSMLERSGCHPLAVARVCSIDLKAEEAGLLAFCQSRSLPLDTFSAQELSAVPGQFTASAFVQSITGVDNVCERAAMLGAGPGARLLTKKYAADGVTMALALSPCPLSFEEKEEAQ